MAYYTDPSVVAGFSTTGDPFIDSLFDADPSYRFAWSTTVGGVTQISYSFPWLNGVGSKFISGYGSGENLRVNSPSSVTASDVTYIGQAFQAWAAVANVNFTQVTETNAGQVGDIRIAFTGVIPSQYWGYTIVTSDGADNSNGDIWISNSVRSESFAPYTYNYNAILHEIGHALGLKHPFEAPTIPSGYDNRRFTIMSYTDPQNAYWYDKSTGTYKYLIMTPMVYDIAAV